MQETRTIEFKETITNTFLKTVSAFSNYNGGKIFFGILDTISYQFCSCRWLAGLYRIKWRFTAGNDTNPYQPLLLVGFPDFVKIAGGYG